ncbi:MAG: cytochrome c-type biogenesis CcmF C-terminal domain-containing protein, partial [Gammaproteobacteria bacterium]|nr:cytochrome c-type biogenesis CcmF C-terminal domain-containing protein [Gammaproteobacteria bacterium]
ASVFVGMSNRIKLKTQAGSSVGTISRSYWGMQLGHLGVAVFIIGVTFVNGYQEEKDVRMDIGDTVEVGGYTFRFDGVTSEKGPNYESQMGRVLVSHDGKDIGIMYPEKRYYNVQQQVMTEAAISTGFFRDLYVSLGEPVGRGGWSVRVYNKPFVDWIWAGCVIMGLGGFLAISDKRYRIASRKEKRQAAEEAEQQQANADVPVTASVEGKA